MLVICGGISAYKTLEIIRLLKKQGATIKSILTKSAKEFVTPLSVASLSQEKIYDDLFNVENEAEMDHISLSRWSDLILVAPATANTISKLSSGSSDDLASTVILASNKEYHIPPELAEVIGTDLLEKINKRGEAETEKKLEEQKQQPQQQQQDFAQKQVPVRAANGLQVGKKKLTKKK